MRKRDQLTVQRNDFSLREGERPKLLGEAFQLIIRRRHVDRDRSKGTRGWLGWATSMLILLE